MIFIGKIWNFIFSTSTVRVENKYVIVINEFEMDKLDLKLFFVKMIIIKFYFILFYWLLVLHDRRRAEIEILQSFSNVNCKWAGDKIKFFVLHKTRATRSGKLPLRILAYFLSAFSSNFPNLNNGSLRDDISWTRLTISVAALAVLIRFESLWIHCNIISPLFSFPFSRLSWKI